MIIDKPKLFLEINDENVVLLCGKFNENFDLKILFKEIYNSKNFKLGFLNNSNDFFKIIQNAIFKVEKEINYTFKNLILILDSPEITSVNISGSKKLSQSQINEDDITFILNNLKQSIKDNYKNYSILHLFNTNFTLDEKIFDNPPVGLIGDKYYHELSFFLLPTNDLKNISLLFKKLNLVVDRFICKNFLEGMSKMQTEKKNNFFKINYNKESCELLFFENYSFVYRQIFKFGSNKCNQDVSKVCSLNEKIVDDIFKKISFCSNYQDSKDKILDKSFFENELFRKISLKHIYEVINARNNEIFDLIFNNNINIKFFKKKSRNVFIEVEDKSVFFNQNEMIKKNFDNSLNIHLSDKTQNDQYQNCLKAAELVSMGWDREVISYTQDKKSIISRIFSTLFK